MAKLKKTKIDNGLSVDSGGAIVGGKNVSLEGHTHKSTDISDFNTSVRNAINSNVGALGNAALLDGHKADEFATKADVPKTQLVWNNIRIENDKNTTEMIRIRLPIGIYEYGDLRNRDSTTINYTIIGNTENYTYILETSNLNVTRYEIIKNNKGTSCSYGKSLSDVFKIAFIPITYSDDPKNRISYIYFNTGEPNDDDSIKYFNIQTIKATLYNTNFEYNNIGNLYNIGEYRIAKDSVFIGDNKINLTPELHPKYQDNIDPNDDYKIIGNIYDDKTIPNDVDLSDYPSTKTNPFNPTGDTNIIRLKDYTYTIGYNKRVSRIGNASYLYVPFIETGSDFLIKITTMYLDKSEDISKKEIYIWRNNESTKSDCYIKTSDNTFNYDTECSIVPTNHNGFYLKYFIFKTMQRGRPGESSTDDIPMNICNNGRRIAFYEISYIYKTNKINSSFFNSDILKYNNIAIVDKNTRGTHGQLNEEISHVAFNDRVGVGYSSVLVNLKPDLSTVDKEMLNVFNSLYLNEAPSPSLKINNTTVTFGGNSDNIIKAPALQTPRKINGVAFDGTKDITITATSSGGNADTLGGVAASNYVKQTQVGNAAGKIPVFTADGKLQYPDGHLEWIE